MAAGALCAGSGLASELAGPDTLTRSVKKARKPGAHTARQTLIASSAVCSAGKAESRESKAPWVRASSTLTGGRALRALARWLGLPSPSGFRKEASECGDGPGNPEVAPPSDKRRQMGPVLDALSQSTGAEGPWH